MAPAPAILEQAPTNRRNQMPHTEQDFIKAYGPVLKTFLDGAKNATQGLLHRNIDYMRKLPTTMTSAEMKAACIAEIEGSMAGYDKAHKTLAP
jgi:hypothetical protein